MRNRYTKVYAELPNPIIPVIFTLVLIIGIGILTSSLGDVVGEEAMTGDRAGYKAQKVRFAFEMLDETC